MQVAKKINPVLQKKYQEGYEKGFEVGVEVGIAKAADFFAEKFEKLQDMPGIGPKTLKKFREAFGEHYFRRVE